MARPRMVRSLIDALITSVMMVLSLTPYALAASPATQPAAIANLSLEELMDIEVTSVSRKSERLSSSASAIDVVTGEDIRRSGAVSIPQALRNVPGLTVAQADSSQWAISARGFNTTSANKLLVMLDGRSVYTPLFSGVFWDAQDTMMEDIDQIEVIRGPGAVQWGANAVNGVISVATKHSKDTQGWLASGGGGTEERGFGGMRYGGRINDHTSYRLYGKYFNRDETARYSGAGSSDQWEMGQGGFRLDGGEAGDDRFTLQGDAYAGHIDVPTTHVERTMSEGGNLLGRWSHTFANDSEFQVQAYHDRTFRNISGTVREKLRTYDLDAQHRFQPHERHEFTWGFGYRYQEDRLRNSALIGFLPAKLDTHLVSLFLQDGITLLPELLRLTIGTRLEHNDFSGFEHQPTARLSWTPAPRHNIWTAVSRAVRTPSRIDRDLVFPSTPPFSLTGDADFRSEELVAYELGYRVQPVDPVFLSLATFYNQYDNLRSLEAGTPGVITNTLEGETYGAELSANYEMIKGLRWHGGYTFLRMQLHRKPGSTDTTSQGQEGDVPYHQVFLGASIDLPAEFELDWTARYIDRLPNQGVKAYLTMDVRLGWRPTDHLELAIVGQNLLDRRHAEFGTPLAREYIEHSLYGKVTWYFQ